MGYGRYTHALVCRVPNSYIKLIMALKSKESAEFAKKEHATFCQVLRDMGVDVIELPTDEALPECPFVNDLAVVCNGIAFMCQPAAAQRKRELDLVRTTLKRELNLPIVEISDPNALIEGGDVLYTGKEFFVGLAQGRTNEAGARALAAAFPEFPVSPIRVYGKQHLKSVITMAGPDVMCIAASERAQYMKREIERNATYKYQTVTVPDDEAANCVYVNGTLLHRQEFPSSTLEFVRKIDYKRVELPLEALSIASIGLSSLAILIKRGKHL